MSLISCLGMHNAPKAFLRAPQRGSGASQKYRKSPAKKQGPHTISRRVLDARVLVSSILSEVPRLSAWGMWLYR